MEYKKYIADTFKEARLKMLIDLGTLGYIVSHRKVKSGGFLGFFRKDQVEITARAWNPLKSNLSKSLEKSKDVSNTENMPFKKSPNSLSSPVVNNNKAKYNNNINKISSSFREKKSSSPENFEIDHLKKEVYEIKNILKSLFSDKNIDNNLSKTQVPIEKDSQDNNHSDFQEKNLNLIKMILREDEFDEKFIQTICSLPNIQKLIQKDLSLKKVKKFLTKEIFQILRIKEGINFNERGNVICIVGPTGVGKTTTIAKLAAYFGVFGKRKVKLISLDTYRIGAIQHLKFYANIMNLPFAKVHSVAEFKKELELSCYDIVFVDTAGRNQKNEEEINDIKKFLKIVNNTKLSVTLVLSATTKYKDLIEILDKFNTLNYKYIIITKLDETNTMGPILSAISSIPKDLIYVAFGQNVPEDIEIASKNKLIQSILKM